MLVTGGAGFIGCNFVRHALAKDPELRLVNVDALTYAGHPASLRGVAEAFGPRYTFVQADIRDAEKMRSLFTERAIDTVVHLAAESHVDRSIDGPRDFVETNLLISRGLNIKYAHDWIDPSRDVETDQQQRDSLGFEYIPYPFVRVGVFVRRKDGPDQVPGTRDEQVDVVFHLFF